MFERVILPIAFAMGDEFGDVDTATIKEQFPRFLVNLNCPFVWPSAVPAVLDIHHY